MTDSPKFPLKYLLIALALCAALRLPSLDLPLDRDEGEYATLGLSLRVGGGVPYRDYLEQKPPLAPMFYAASQSILGESINALRISVILWQMAATAALFLLLWRRLKDSGSAAAAALAAAAVFACTSAGVRVQGLSANTELFTTLPMIAALALAPQWLAAGAMVGVAGLFKQSALPLALLLPLFAPAASWRERGKAAGLSLAGAALPWAGMLLIFAFADGAGAFWECVVSYNLRYAGQGMDASWRRLLGALIRIKGEQGLLWLVLPWAWYLAWSRESGGLGRLAAAWLAAAVLGVMMGGRYYPHYFQVLAGPAALLAGLAWAFTDRLWPKAALAVLAALVFLNAQAGVWQAEDGSARSEAMFGMKEFAAAARAGEILRQQTPEGSRLLMWGSQAGAFYTARRLPASRFLFNYPFTGEAPYWPGGDQELLRAVLDPNTSAALLEPLNPRDPLQRKLGEAIQRNYHLRADLAPPFILALRKR